LAVDETEAQIKISCSRAQLLLLALGRVKVPAPWFECKDLKLPSLLIKFPPNIVPALPKVMLVIEFTQNAQEPICVTLEGMVTLVSWLF
jgi:hypothetical protein